MNPGVAVAAFAAWLAIVLVTLHPLHAAALVAGWRAWWPALPAAAATSAHLRELASRLLLGHLGTLLWLPAAAGFGGLVLRLVGPARLPRVDRWLLAGGAGAATAAAGWFGLGLVGLWFPSLAWLGALLGLGLLFTGRHATLPTAPDPAGSSSGSLDRILGAVLAAELAVAALLVLGRTVLPETAFDALSVHLARPARYVMLHRIDSEPHLMPEFVPMTALTLLGWPWLLVGEPGARAWRFWLFAALLVLVWRLAASAGGRRAGLAAAVLAAASPQILRLAPATMVDLEGCAFVLLAAGCAWRARLGPRRGAWVVLAGGFAGAAVSAKVLTAFVVPGLLWAAVGRQRLGGLRRIALFGLAASIPLLAWACRSWIVVGNPLYPFVSDRMPTFDDVPAAVRVRLQGEWFVRVTRGPAEWGLLPVRLARSGYDDTALGFGALMAAPLLLAAPPAGAAGIALLVALPSLALWIWLTHLVRYGLAAWLLLFVAIGGSVGTASRQRGRIVPRLGLAAVALAGLIALAEASARWGGPQTDVWLGRESPTDRWDRLIPNGYGPAARWAGDHLPADARLLLVGETRGAYWPRLATHDGPYEEQAISRLARASTTPNQLAHRLRQQASDLFVNDDEAGRLVFTYGYPLFALGPRETALLAALWRSWIDEDARFGRQTIVHLRSTPRTSGRGPALPLCLQPGAFARAYGIAPSWSWQAPPSPPQPRSQAR